jgi:diguanylate cyclase (GGDEF)-like protein
MNNVWKRSGDGDTGVDGRAPKQGGRLSELLSLNIVAADGTRSTVPPLALLLSLLCLAVAMIGSTILSNLLTAEIGLLVWVLALVPPFLLSYYRGWRGAATALAAGMAAFSLGHSAVIFYDVHAPSVTFVIAAITTLVVVSAGSGLLSSIFQNSLRVAREQALIDLQTGLPNRRHAMLHLHRMFAAAERGRVMTMVIFDLDQLAMINRSQGRKEGDRVLMDMAKALQDVTRAMNLSARTGGDEFTTILDGMTATGAIVFVDKVFERFGRKQYSWGTPTVSAGIAQYEDGMKSPEVLIAAADQGLYRAKSAGGNRWIRVERQGSVPASEPQDGRSDGDGDGYGETILVVDDDVAVLKLLGKVLMRGGYQVLEATGPSEAMAYVDPDRRVDLIVTDIVMPEMSGFRLVEALGAQRANLRVLYISGFGQDEILWAGVPGAAKGFLAKPLEPKEILASVRYILDQEIRVRSEDARAVGENSPYRLRGDVELVEHVRSRLSQPAGSLSSMDSFGSEVADSASDILVVEELSEELIATWERGEEPLPDLVIALDMTWSTRIKALEAGVIDVLPHDMLAGELEARVAGAIKRLHLRSRFSPAEA